MSAMTLLIDVAAVAVSALGAILSFFLKKGGI